MKEREYNGKNILFTFPVEGEIGWKVLQEFASQLETAS